MTLFYFIAHYKKDSYYNMPSLFYNSGDSTLLNYLQHNLVLFSIVSEMNGLASSLGTGQRENALKGMIEVREEPNHRVNIVSKKL